MNNTNEKEKMGKKKWILMLGWRLSEKTFWWVKLAFFYYFEEKMCHFDYCYQIIIKFYAFCQNMSENDTILQMSLLLIS